MATQLRSFGWATWLIVFIVVLLILFAGLWYVAE